MKGYDEKYLQSCIDKAKKSWEGVDTDKFMNEIRGKEDTPNEELNKAAEEYAKDETMSGLAERAFKAGAEWMAGQGYKQTERVYNFNGENIPCVSPVIYLPKEFEIDDKVIVQIRKK